jgi:hypothetical protein
MIEHNWSWTDYRLGGYNDCKKEKKVDHYKNHI